MNKIHEAIVYFRGRIERGVLPGTERFYQTALEVLREVMDWGKLGTKPVAIVRCRDCSNTCPGYYDDIICTMWGARTDPDGWCHLGERRQADE